MDLGDDQSGDGGRAATTHRRAYQLLVVTAGLWGLALVASLVQFGVPNGECTFFSSSLIAALGATWSGLFAAVTGVIFWLRRPSRPCVKPSRVVYVGVVILLLLATATTYVFSVSDYQGYNTPVTSNCLDF